MRVFLTLALAAGLAQSAFAEGQSKQLIFSCEAVSVASEASTFLVSISKDQKQAVVLKGTSANKPEAPDWKVIPSEFRVIASEIYEGEQSISIRGKPGAIDFDKAEKCYVIVSTGYIRITTAKDGSLSSEARFNDIVLKNPEVEDCDAPDIELKPELEISCRLY